VKSLWKKKNGYLVMKLSTGQEYKIGRVALRIFFYTWLVAILAIGAIMFFNKEKYYVGCPSEAVAEQCGNPFYQSKYCKEGHWKLPGFKEWLNHNNLCDRKVLYAGEQIGSKPHWVTSNIGMLTFGWFVLFFVMNHLIYNRKKIDWGELREDSSDSEEE
jgi:hypothetical protein